DGVERGSPRSAPPGVPTGASAPLPRPELPQRNRQGQACLRRVGATAAGGSARGAAGDSRVAGARPGVSPAARSRPAGAAALAVRRRRAAPGSRCAGAGAAAAAGGGARAGVPAATRPALGPGGPRRPVAGAAALRAGDLRRAHGRRGPAHRRGRPLRVRALQRPPRRRGEADRAPARAGAARRL
ncbi:MAG: hypothetical protein AVDCRST_MAG38-390, partial [uncultured Solirubrobacteraceae bacterium]